MVTPQTLGMYYYGLAKLIKKDRFHRPEVFDKICAYLVSDGCPLLDENQDDFSSGLQVTGLIAHSAKHVRRAHAFEESHQKLISEMLDRRLDQATYSSAPLFLNAHELVSLKLLAIGLGKD